jgi:tRNA threonylcarbamoyladenosine biosynthesis protein TsaE
MDIGYEDYFYSGDYCLVEWPDNFQELLPENYVQIEIEVGEDDETRIIRF